jgi:S1-C subfamily serine protease
MLDFSALLNDNGRMLASTQPPPLSLVRADGVEVGARFIGLDASTGLSLLEALQPLAPPAPETISAQPTVGQRVRVIAPVPAGQTGPNVTTIPGNTANAANAAQTATPAPAEAAPIGESGVIYMNMSQAAGQLTEVRRSPTGKPFEVTIEVERVSPEWAGGVAFGETGTLVGIVDESDERGAHLVSAETVRAAAARVQARRASVPQPWLGARGDSVATTKFELFVARGWPEQAARMMMNRHQGVLLTEVAPGTPAAVAGLRPGDVIARISQHEVRGVEDMSQMLRELGSNTVAKFTILRGAGPPLDLSVRLSEAQNPALETAQAEALAAEGDVAMARSEARASEAEMRLLEAEVRTAQAELREQEFNARTADAEHKEIEAQRLRAAQQREQAARQRVASAYARIEAAHVREANARARITEADARIKAAGVASFGLPTPLLLHYGLEAINLRPKLMPQPGAQAGLLVINVRKDSAAAHAGLKPGDIIETINGRQPVPGTGWDDLMEAEAKAGCTLGVLRDMQKLTLTMPPEKEN